MTFADKVLNLRKRASLSQEELAEKLDISRQAISRWEMGLAMPDAANLLQLSKLFCVTVDYLVNDEYSSDEDIPIVKTKEASLNREMKKLSVMIRSVLMGTLFAVLLAVVLFSFMVELPILIIPIIVLPFPMFYISVFHRDLQSLKLILPTSAVLLLVVNVIAILGVRVSGHIHLGAAYGNMILWDCVICFTNAAALVSFGSYAAFVPISKKCWSNLLIYALVSVFWIAETFLLNRILVAGSMSHIITLFVGILLCIVGCTAYILQIKYQKWRNEDDGV